MDTLPSIALASKFLYKADVQQFAEGDINLVFYLESF
jgi:hypothetical protein